MFVNYSKKSVDYLIRKWIIQVSTRNLKLVTKQFKFILTSHILPTWANEAIEDIGDHYPVFYKAFVSYEMLYSTRLIRCSLFYCLWLEAGGYFCLDNFNVCVYGQTGVVLISGVFLSLSSKHMLALDKIHMTVISTAFV